MTERAALNDRAMGSITKTKRRASIRMWGQIVLWSVMAVVGWRSHHDSAVASFSARRRLQEQQQVLPTIFTFYSQINDVKNPAGMSHASHSTLLRFWVKAWKRAGWNPIVLDETDAMKHPEYARLQGLVEQTGAGTYNQLCFLRWLAMAQVGGGWMSDYDVFPLHDFRQDGFYLPNDGVLTIHNRLCPSLVSGTASEWYKVANAMIPFAAENQINSDQKSLAEIWNRWSPPPFVRELSVTQRVLNATNWRHEHCDEYTPPSMRAVHFAHTPVKKAIAEGKLPAGTTIQHRAEIATRFMDKYLQHCSDKITTYQPDESVLANSVGNNRQPISGYSGK